MSKMIEAAEKKYGMRWRELSMDIQEDFESGWVAAIAAVKEGGPVARLIPVQTDEHDTPRVWARTWGEYSAESSYANQYRTGDETSLYKLPEDV